MATGLDSVFKKQSQPESSKVSPISARPADKGYKGFEKPAIERNKPAPAAAPLPTVGSAAAKPDDGYEYMDVPAFLRRQAN